jgi:hypothetical protein
MGTGTILMLEVLVLGRIGTDVGTGALCEWLDASCPADAADRWPLQPQGGVHHTPLVIHMDGWDDPFWVQKGPRGAWVLGS